MYGHHACPTFAGHARRFEETADLIRRARALLPLLPAQNGAREFHVVANALRLVVEGIAAGYGAGATAAATHLAAALAPNLPDGTHRPLPPGMTRTLANAVRARKAVTRGAIGRGARHLQAGDPYVVDSPAKEAAVEALAPPAPPLPPLTFAEKRHAPPRLALRCVKRLIHTKDPASHPGSSGVGYRVISTLVKKLGNHWAHAVTIVTQSILDGWYIGSVAEPRLSACLLILLKKPTGDKPRPIGIGEVLCNIGRSLVAAEVVRALATSHPHDYGLARKAGTEAALRHVMHHLESHPDHVALALDCTNAFGSILREAIRTGATELAPKLLTPLFAAYSGATPAYYARSDGSYRTLLLRRGVRQGDALGPALFSVGLLPILRLLRSQHPDVVILSYLDDLVMLGDLAAVLAALGTAQELLKGVGLQLNRSKCRLLAQQVPSAAAAAAIAAADLQPASDHLTTLGGTVGAPERVREFLLAKAQTFSALCTAIRDARGLGLPAHGLYKVLRFCAVPTILHLFRPHAPSATLDLANSARSAILDAFYSLLNVDRPVGPGLSDDRVFAPLAVGGLGMPDPLVIRSAGYVACAAQVTPDTLPGTPLHDIPEFADSLTALVAMIAGPDATADARSRARAQVTEAVETPPTRHGGVQHRLTAIAATAIGERRLGAEPDPVFQAIQTSGRGPESWTPFTLDHEFPQQLADDAFRAAALLRSGYPSHPNRTHCHRCDGAAGPSIAHDLNCRALHNTGASRRHSKVGEALQDAVKRANIQDITFSTETPKYDTMFNRKAAAPTNEICQADVWVGVPSAGAHAEGKRFAVDFTVSGPTQANLAVARITTGAIAAAAEKIKLDAIDKHFHIPEARRHLLVPFAVEVTGTMGTHARGLMSTINAAYVARDPDAEAEEHEYNRHPVRHGEEDFDSTPAGRRLWRMKAAITTAVHKGNARILDRYSSSFEPPPGPH